MEHSGPSGSSSTHKKPPSTTKKESEHKRETRSRHEKKRREEMNQVFAEMLSLLPEDVRKDVFKMQHADHKPKRPDKCFIISNAVEFIRKNVKKAVNLVDPITQDSYNLTNCFVLTMKNMILESIDGDHRVIFDVEKKRMLGKDLRCFVDFESARKLSFLKPEDFNSVLTLRSFMAKAMSCKIKKSDQNPAELILVCVPDQPLSQPEEPSPPVSQLEQERPILAALLRRKDPPIEETPPITSQSSPVLSVPIHKESPPTQNPTPSKKTVLTKRVIEKGKRRRLRSMNAIVESYSLDEVPERKKPRKNGKSAEMTSSFGTTSSQPTTIASFLPSSLTTPVAIPTTSFIHPIISPTSSSSLNLHTYDMLAPNYKDIWLRLQSERLLLEERISAKEGELKNLMLTVPQYFPANLTTIPQYNLPQTTLDMIQQL